MNLEERVLDTIKKNLQKKQEVKLESNIKEDLMMDSFDIIMMITALEDEFSITIDEDEFEGVTIVKDIVDQFKKNYK